MAKEILFISDLHLSESGQSVAKAFHSFIEQQAGKCQALYILGDLFEYWIGDDDLSPFNQQIIQRLASLQAAGTALYIQRGNRDFLLDNKFADMACCTLLPDEHVIEHNGVRALLMHGDTLCLDDSEYLEFRKMVRSSQWQEELLAKPLEERRALAASIREESRTRKSNLPENIMDVTDHEVENKLREHEASLLIHGHTHRPNVHEHDHGTRFVLGDWDKKGWYIRWASGKPELCDFEIAS